MRSVGANVIIVFVFFHVDMFSLLRTLAYDWLLHLLDCLLRGVVQKVKGDLLDGGHKLDPLLHGNMLANVFC